MLEDEFEDEVALVVAVPDGDGDADFRQRSTLPIMTSCVVVLLKLLLATVTSPGANGLNAGLPGAGLTSPTSEMPRELPLPST